MKLFYASTALLLLFLVMSCHSRNEQFSDTTENKIYEPEEAADEQAPQPPGNSNIPAPGYDRKIIKHATLNLEVKEYDKYYRQTQGSLKQYGAYIAREEQNNASYRKENTITIKVPVDQFDPLLQSLSNESTIVHVRKVESQDVTGDVFDVRAALEAKQQIRLRYLDFLKQAKNIQDMLQVQKEINAIQMEIASVEGRKQYLVNASAYSTIELTFFQVLSEAPAADTEPGFGQRLLDSLKSGLYWMGELMIVLLTLWPVWAGVALAVWGYRKWRVRGNKLIS